MIDCLNSCITKGYLNFGPGTKPSTTLSYLLVLPLVGFDINVLLREAKSRWLKPSEVYYILLNHEQLQITHEPPNKPPSKHISVILRNLLLLLFYNNSIISSLGGSLFLYNRRVNRFFRKDGYAWRRKKDGRTVGEAHERLKVCFRKLSIVSQYSSYFCLVNTLANKRGCHLSGLVGSLGVQVPSNNASSLQVAT